MFFENCIKRLYREGIIDWCYWIRHNADTDDTKSHIHFVLKPSKRVDCNKLRLYFVELVSDSDCPPLCCTSKWFFTSSLDDWLLYCVHDIGYLSSKGLHRNYHYGFDDFRATDYDALRVDWTQIDRTKFLRLQYLEDAVRQHIPFVELVQQGVIPIGQRAQYEMQFTALARYLFGDDDDLGEN